MNKKIYIVSLLVLSFVSVLGQQIPLGNLYNSNEFLINSAESAADTVPVIFLTHRKQWIGTQGDYSTPRTSMMNGHTLINKNSAIGFKIFSDKTNLISQNYGMVSYAHRFIFNPHTALAFGLSAGYYQNTIRFENIIAEDYSDIILANSKSVGSTYESSASVMFVKDHFKIGIAIPRLIESTTSSNFNLKRNYLIYSRFHYDLNKDYKVEPSVLVKISPQVHQQVDINMDLLYKDLFSIGGGYRTKEAIMLRASLKIERTILSYSYEFLTKGFTQYSNGSHEVRLGFTFGRKPKPEKPIVEEKVYYHFKALPSEDEILLNIAVGDKNLADDLKELTDESGFRIYTNEEDKSYIIEVPTESGNRKFKFQSLYALRQFNKELQLSDKSLSMDERINNSDIILKYEIDRKFETLKPQDDIILSIKNENPLLAADLQTLSDRDDVELKITKDGYVLDIGDESTKKRYVFKNLSDMNKFMLDLKEKDPTLKGNLSDIIDDSQLMQSYEDKNFKYQRLDKYDKPLQEIATRSPRLVAEIKTLMTNRDDVEIYNEKKGYSLIIGENLDKRKFNFQTLGEMNTFMLKLKNEDPNLKSNPLEAVDKSELMQRYEDKNYVYRKLKSSQEFMLSIGNENPTLSQNLIKIAEDRTDIIVSKDKYDRYDVELRGTEGEKKNFKFETLEELSSFANKISSTNLSKDDNLLKVSDNLGLKVEQSTFTEEDIDKIHELLYFNIGSYEITGLAKKNVDEKIKILKTKEFKKIIIAGYTCNLGSEELNKSLSKKRAKRIADYFISQGIPADKIEIYGKGPEYPLYPNDTDEHRKLNRRVEFEVYF